MSDTLARLRASKAKNENESQQAGQKLAQWWCTHRAEYAEIKRLAAFRDSCGTDFDRVVNENLGHTLAKCASGDDGDAGGFWDGFDVTEEQQRNEDFLLGFLEGVETFWEKVASEI